MKIGHTADKGAIAPAQNGTARSTGDLKAQGSKTETEASAKVELSSAAHTLQAGAAGTQGDFDAEKVSRIAKAIADGSFTINASAIADKLISNAQELIGKTSH